MAQSGDLAAKSLWMKLLGANRDARGEASAKTVAKSNYLLGSNPKNWTVGVDTYGKVRFREVYPGIDIVYYGNQELLEYDFELAPGADLSQVRIQFTGNQDLSLDAQGNLQIDFGAIRLQRPVAYQEISGNRQPVEVRYRIEDGGQVSLTASPYDSTRRLTVDPVLVFAAAIGGDSIDINSYTGEPLTADASGNLYMTGLTCSANFPVVSAVQPTRGNCFDAFVAKLSPDGSTLLFSTFLGGTAYEEGRSVAVDAAGNVYVAGRTDSADFPVLNAAQGVYAGSTDSFLVKLNNTGSAFVFSTYLGGSSLDEGRAIAVDPTTGSVAVGGNTSSSNFPTTPGAYQTAYAGLRVGFISKYSPTGSLVLSSFLGGTVNFTELLTLRLTPDGSIYAGGVTAASDFPTTPGAYQTTYRGGQDGFITKFNPSGSTLAFSTLFGGSGEDRVNSIAIDASQNVFLAGPTGSADLPTSPGAFDTTVNTPGYDGFVSKISADGSALLASTYLGGTKDDYLRKVAIDSGGNVVVAGSGYSSELPVLNALQTTRLGVPTPLYRSGDGGATWTGITPSQTGLNFHDFEIKSIAVAPSNTSRIYAYTVNCGMLRSDDRGATWTRASFTCGGGSERLTADPTNANKIYLVGQSGVRVSTDAGASFSPINAGLPVNKRVTTLAVSSFNPTVLYAGSDDFAGIYKSTDGGSSWSLVAGPSSTTRASRIWLSPSNSQTLYIYSNGFYRSFDSGVSLASISVQACCNIEGFAVHPTDGNTLYYAGGSGTFSKSVNAGNSWISYSILGGSGFSGPLALNSANPSEIYYANEPNGVYKTLDGGVTWNPVNGTAPLRQDRITALGISPGASTAVAIGFTMGQEGHFAKFNSALTNLVSASYYGILGDDHIGGMVTIGEDVVVYGRAQGSLIVTPGAYSSPTRGNTDLQVARITSGNGGCSTTLQPASIAGDYYGGNAHVRILTGGGCPWNVSSAPAWVTLGPSNSGSGLGLVEVEIPKNTGGVARASVITINGQSVTISQPGGPACSISSSTPVWVVGSTAQSSSNALSVSGTATCQFTSVSDSAWATITSGSSIIGSGNIGVSLSANSSSTARTATITITSIGGVATATIKIHQSGIGCTNSLTSSSTTVPAGGGSFDVQFNTAPTGCASWGATSNSNWITRTSSPGGTGSTTASFTALPNAWNAPRVGSVNVGGQTFTVTQSAGSGCSPSGVLTSFAPLSSALSAADCSSQWRNIGQAGSYAKQYTFAGTAGDRIAIEVTAASTSLRPFVYLIAPDGSVLNSGDSSRGDLTVARAPDPSGLRTLPTTGTYRVEVTNRSTNQAGNFSVRLVPGCTLRAALSSIGIPAAGGTFAIPISTESNCSWGSTNFAPSWLTVTSPAVRTGSGSVTFTVQPRVGGLRSTTLSVGDRQINLWQSSPTESYPFSPSFAFVPAAGVSGQTVQVPPILSGQPASSTAWIQLVSTDVATGQITYTVTANSGPGRTGQILLGNDRMTIVQGSSVPDKIGIYANGAWVMDLNGNGAFEGNPTDKYVEFGNSLYSPVLGDWMAQAKTSMAIFYNGLWYADFNQNRQWDGSVLDLAAGLGGAGWTPISGDWDGDGTVNIGVYNNGSWYLDWNGDMKWEAGVDKVYTFGGGGATPIVGDWNLDGKTEIGAYINGLWYLDYDGDGAYVPANDKQVGFGVAGFLPVIGDWNGDGRSKIGIVRNGEWYVDYNGNFQFDGTSVDRGVYLGTTGWLPVIGDWNGDGRKKIGIFKDGQWILDYNGNYLLDGPDKNYMFGAAGQKPIVGKW